MLSLESLTWRGGGRGGGHKQHKIMERPLKPKQGTVLQVFLQQVVAPLRMRESDRFKQLSIRDPSCSNAGWRYAADKSLPSG